MTKKHFEALIYGIAHGLNHAAHCNEKLTGERESFHGEDLRIARLTAKHIGEAIADELAAFNPRFDRARFDRELLTAVGEQLEHTPRRTVAA
jgi:hypothetical protein